jgi:hypothetical protein
MDTNFICKRCHYETYAFKDLVRHCKKKNKCSKNLESYNYSDDQLLVMSLMPYHNNIHSIKNTEIEHLRSSNILYNNLNNYLNTINKLYKSKNKDKKCEYCNESFCKLNELKKHMIINCYHQYLLNENENNNINKNIINNGIIGNNNNIINNINQQNIYVEIKNPIQFDELWDISGIDIKTKFFIIFNNLMYTSLLEEILKNEINLNIIIDKNTNSGLVYKNNIEEYIEMKLKDIVNITMEKLKNQLLEINNDIQDKVFKDVSDYYRKMITKKYIDYTKDKDIQEQVIGCVSNIFEKKKEDAIKISKILGY